MIVAITPDLCQTIPLSAVIIVIVVAIVIVRVGVLQSFKGRKTWLTADSVKLLTVLWLLLL